MCSWPDVGSPSGVWTQEGRKLRDWPFFNPLICWQRNDAQKRWSSSMSFACSTCLWIQVENKSLPQKDDYYLLLMPLFLCDSFSFTIASFTLGRMAFPVYRTCNLVSLIQTLENQRKLGGWAKSHRARQGPGRKQTALCRREVCNEFNKRTVLTRDSGVP